MGSKNRLAERIIELLPQADHLVDLFCGGCAIAHCAILQGKYQHVHINDLNWMCPTFFTDVLQGKYRDEHRWISREEFNRLKTTDPYVAFVWSFGNNLRDYMYSRQIEPLKHAIHLAIYDHDYEPARQFGFNLDSLEQCTGTDHDRYLQLRHLMKEQLQEITPPLWDGQQQSTERILRLLDMADATHRSQATTPTSRENFFFWNRQHLRAEHTERTLQLAVIRESLQSKPSWRAQNESGDYPPIQPDKVMLTSSVLDYRSVAIPDRSVIYCDIPYTGTQRYGTKKQDEFDLAAFTQWARQQQNPVYVSSYNLPEEDYDIVAEFAHRTTLSATANNKVTERLYRLKQHPN